MFWTAVVGVTALGRAHRHGAETIPASTGCRRRSAEAADARWLVAVPDLSPSATHADDRAGARQLLGYANPRSLGRARTISALRRGQRPVLARAARPLHQV